jgi:hypothetical protein
MDGEIWPVVLNKKAEGEVIGFEISAGNRTGKMKANHDVYSGYGL